ncbi:MAG: hypothetical protein ACI9JE_001155 [Candidatus Krumholzibacteriia bacterium]
MAEFQVLLHDKAPSLSLFIWKCVIANSLPKIKGLICALTLLVASGQAVAADLAGTVTDGDTGVVVRFAQLQILNQDSGVDIRIATVQTDSLGRFLWRDLPPGNFEIECSAESYEPLVTLVVLGDEDLLDLDLALTSNVFVLDELVVVGQSSDIEGDLQTGYVNLDRETLASVPSIIEPDPLRALQMLPGVQAASDISSGLYIRGGGPDQTLVLMDGVPVYNPTHAFGFFSTFNNDAVSDLALYKGAYPAPYGGRLGAVVDVEMREETAPKFSGTAGLSLIAGRVFLEGRLGQEHWWVAGRRSFIEPLLGAIRTEENPIPDFYFYDMNASLTSYRWGGVTRLSFYRGRDKLFVDADETNSIDLGWGNTVAMLRHQRFLSDNIEGQMTLSYSKYESLTEAELLATNIDIINELDDVSIGGQLDWRAAEDHRVLTGAKYSWYNAVYRQEFNRSVDQDYSSLPRELAVFAEDNYFVDDRSTIRGGVRYRHLSDGNRNLWEPRLAMNRKVHPKLMLKLGGGIYHQALQLVSTEGFSASDFYVSIDETANVGRSWQIVAGGDWQATMNNKVSVEVYNTDLKDLVQLDTKAPVDQTSYAAQDLFVTDGKGYARGMEVFWQHTRPQWSVWLGYTLGWTRRTFPELNGGEEFVPKYDRRHDINLTVSRRAGVWKLAAAFRYATGQAFTPAAARYQIPDPSTGETDEIEQILPGSRNSGRLLPYHRLDVSARRPIGLFGLEAELVLEVFNLYNRRNEWFVQFDSEEETTTASVVKMLPLIPSIGVNVAF